MLFRSGTHWLQVAARIATSSLLCLRPTTRGDRYGAPGAEAAIEDGFACDAGLPSCTGGTPGHMTVVNDRWDEAERRRLLQDVLLPRWVARCGADCATTWDRIAAPELGLRIRPVR